MPTLVVTYNFEPILVTEHELDVVAHAVANVSGCLAGTIPRCQVQDDHCLPLPSTAFHCLPLPSTAFHSLPLPSTAFHCLQLTSTARCKTTTSFFR